MSFNGNTSSSDESFLDGEHAIFLEQVYQQYQQNPDEISAEWRGYFERIEQEDTTSASGSGMVHNPAKAMASGDNYTPQSVLERRSFQVKVSQLINAYRYLGHLGANTNPLGDDYGERPDIPQLELTHHELDKTDQSIAFDPGSFNIEAEPTLGNIVHALKETYTRTTGFEYMHITDVTEKRWIQARIENGMARDAMTTGQRKTLLKQLTAAEGFEQYLHRRYVGQKRFGLEGGESLIPLLHVLVQDGGSDGLEEAVIGMAHRGRLNVLINLMSKPSGMLFDEFDGKTTDDESTGDVKYHKGYSNDVMTPGGSVHLALAFNPSHLEIVSPVVEGSVRARQRRRQDIGQDLPTTKVMGIIIHGDAAFAGQGVVMETFSMAQTRGYRTGGTVHIVVNNQVGFTTSTAADSRSSHYPTDVAKMVNAPIIHVNGDDPEAVVYAAKVALDYRKEFNKDIVIDLVCYRRQGHNEADEPFMTQPIMYSIIRKLKTTRTQYAEHLVATGVLTQDESDGLVKEYRELMDAGAVTDSFVGDSSTGAGKALPEELQTPWNEYTGSGWRNQVDTTISKERIEKIAANWVNSIPEDFEVHRRVRKVLDDRTAMANGEKSADWGFGETLAYAALLEDNVAVRLSGQDCGRGTFSHRHAVLHNQKQRQQWIPLQHSAEEQAAFVVIDSLLSEEAVLAFEYGFATTDPATLVIWEAQFGDFVNGAQVVIDQFISSGEQKWQRLCGLAMFLPHGFEGQGPEHSSARLERFVQLAAQENMQIVVPSTPAQTFHMIRQQMLRKYRKPLIVMTPKSLLRHPLATNELSDFTDGKFEFVIDDVDLVSAEDKAAVKRVVICSGKVYYDLLAARRENGIKDVALIRLEQLYPFPGKEMTAIIDQYPNLEEKVWCQEEPVNQGAWDGILPRFEAYCGYHDLICVSRDAAAAPAVGSAKIHAIQQEALVRKALKLGTDADV